VIDHRKRRAIWRRLASEKKILWSLLIRVGSSLLIIATSIALARLLGIEGFGSYSFALAVAAILQLPATAGTNTLVLRETSAGLARGHHALVKGLWGWSLRFVLKLSGLVVCTAFAFLLMLKHGSWTEREWLLVIAILAVPILACSSLFSARVRGVGLIIFSQIPEQVLRPGVSLLLVFAIYLWIGELSGIAAMSIYFLSAAAVLTVLIAVFGRVTPNQMKKEVSDQSAAPLWRRSLVALTMLSGLQILDAQLAIVLMGALSNLEAVAEFRLAISLATFGTFGGQVVSIVLGPEFSRANATEDQKWLRSLTRRAVGLGFLASVPVLGILIIFPEHILGIAYGNEFVGATSAVIICSMGYLVITALGYCSMILVMTGHEKVSVVGRAVGLLSNVALLTLLVPSMGSVGAAIALSCSMVLVQGFLLLNVVNKLGIDPSILSVLRYLLVKRKKFS